MINFKKSELYNGALQIFNVLRQKGFDAFFVGGCVRDSILGRQIKDIDIVTSALPSDIQSIFQKTYNIGEAFGIVNVVENSINYEVATFRKESGYTDGRHPESVEYAKTPQEDSKRRDFTINALYYSPLENHILDFADGISDLKKGILRTIGHAEDRFNEDYLRMLRAIRFGIRFDFSIDDEIITAIKKLSSKTQLLSQERVRDELTKIFTGPCPDKALSLLDETGLLSVLLPDISAMKGIAQPEKYHPEGDVFEHTKLMLSNMPVPSDELAWAVLLHDVGKPQTFSIGEDGNEKFICHAEHGTTIAERILKELRFPSNFIDNVCFAVKNHMRFASVCDMRPSKYKALIAESTFPLELELHRIDCMSSNKFTDSFIYLLDKLIELNGVRELPEELIKGRDLIELGFIPGPKFGEILKNITELQNDKVINTKEDALEYIKLNFLTKV
ncbi:MAG: CCA tRNA nucleotidyltransferase [Lentisphaerota bacterium]